MGSKEEVEKLSKQLNAFAAANELRDENTALRKLVAQLEQEVTRLRALVPQHERQPRPMLTCLCCDADMAPADSFDGQVWEWAEGAKRECEHCGWVGFVDREGSSYKMAECEEDKSGDLILGDEESEDFYV